MTPQPQTETTKPPPKPIEYTRISVVYFHGSVNICGEERDSAALWLPSNAQAHKPGNVVDGIQPVALLSDGTYDCTGKVATGYLFRKKRPDPRSGKLVIEQSFVPLARVRSVTYGAE